MHVRSQGPSLPPARGDQDGFRAELDELADRGAELARGLEAFLTGEGRDADGLTRLLACRASITEQRVALLVRWMAQIDARVRRVESHLNGLSREVSGHEEALKLLCEILQKLDDPYGFGLSLDERIGTGFSCDIPDDRED